MKKTFLFIIIIIVRLNSYAQNEDLHDSLVVAQIKEQGGTCSEVWGPPINYDDWTIDLNAPLVLKRLEVQNATGNMVIRGCTQLVDLFVHNCQLSSLDVEDCINMYSPLGSLYVTFSQITSLNVSNCPKLDFIGCAYNNLSSLNISGCPSITYIYCSHNNLHDNNLSSFYGLNNLASLFFGGCDLYETNNNCFSQSAIQALLNTNPNLYINWKPCEIGAAGNIIGPTSVCQGQNSVVYSIPPIADAIGYEWSLPEGVNITDGDGNSITVEFLSNSSVSGNITVKGRRECVYGDSSSLAVNVHPLPNAAILPIGPISVNYPATQLLTAITNAVNPTYQWKLNGSDIIGANASTLNVDTSGMYSIVIIDEGLCSILSDLVEVTVNRGSKDFNARVFLEGLYAEGDIMNQAQGISKSEFDNNIADKITVELHNISEPFDIAYVFNEIDLKTNGSIEIKNLPSSLNGFYYIAIKHRNSIETWSTLPVDFSGTGPFSYDFSTLASQAYGNNLKLMDNVYAIYGGDASQDGVVDATDMALVDNANRPPPLIGYNVEDVNGDGVVDGSDMAMIDNNSRPPVVQVRRPQ